MRSQFAARILAILGCLAGLSAVGARIAYAQKVSFRGIVNDSSGAPIRDASVGIAELRQLTRTDDQGRFEFRRVPAGSVELSVRRLGFEPRTVMVVVTPARGDPTRVVLVPQPPELAAINVTVAEVRRRQGIEDFHQRRIRGMGDYVTREEILARGTSRPSDVLRGVPGVRIVRLRGGGQGLRFVHHATMQTNCMPLIWIDGQRAPGMEIDDVSVTDLEGIELYPGPSTTPLQFSQSQSVATCGTVVFWTRTPGR